MLKKCKEIKMRLQQQIKKAQMIMPKKETNCLMNENIYRLSQKTRKSSCHGFTQFLLYKIPGI